MSELFDVVDEQDRVLRREARAEVHRQRLLHRAVHILVFNIRGEVYLQRRSAKKDTYPHRWTTSCSGHVDAGEDYDTAAVRELAEELGLGGAKVKGTEGLRHKGTEGKHATANNPSLKSKLKPRNSKLETILPFLKHTPCRETGWEFIWIYTLTTDAAPVPDPGEISEGRWVAPAELDAWMAREPKAFTPSFILVWKLWRKAKA
jgi:isopentenyldiphosphate isomerase